MENRKRNRKNSLMKKFKAIGRKNKLMKKPRKKQRQKISKKNRVNVHKKNFVEKKIKINEDNEKKEIYIINEDENDKTIIPGLIGLSNIGATCYMNATLQCFSNVVRLRQMLLKEDVYNNLEKEKTRTKLLSFSFAEVLYNIWVNNNNTNKYYAPENFKNVISKMNPLFKGIEANDSKDLILFMLENIHNELNIKDNMTLNSNITCNPDPRNFNEVYKDFKDNYINYNDSIISQEFYGFNDIQTKCATCQTIIHNVQLYNILFFPLEEVRKFKNYNFNTVSINDCFEYNQKMDYYPLFYCNYCRNNCQAFSQTFLIDAPKTLIINLNRGKGIQFNINIKFEEFLNLKNYVFNNQQIYYYELIGVLSHYGPSNMGGHFISFCKNSEDGNWYKFNDAMVDLSSFDEVCNSGMPYVLFYSYINV